MLPRATYIRKVANELFTTCQNRLKVRSTADERFRDRQIWCLTKAVLQEFPADAGEPITEEWLSAVGWKRRGGRLVYGILWIDVAENEDGWAVGIGNLSQHATAIKVRNRGEVLRAMSLFVPSVPTSEPSTNEVPS